MIRHRLACASSRLSRRCGDMSGLGLNIRDDSGGNEDNASAAEDFTLMMRVLPNVITLGDTPLGPAAIRWPVSCETAGRCACPVDPDDTRRIRLSVAGAGADDSRVLGGRRRRGRLKQSARRRREVRRSRVGDDRLHCHSERSAVSGSSFAARRAGKYPARKTTPPSSPAATTNASGSAGDVS